jgi:condensin complex subunit 1
MFLTVCCADVVDAIAESSEAITREEVFDPLKGLLKYCHLCTSSLTTTTRSFAELNRTSMTKLMDVIVSGLNSQAEALASELESPDAEGLDSFRRPLEMYSFLLLWIITCAESVTNQKNSASARESNRGKQGKTKQSAAAKEQAAQWDCASQLQTAFDVMCKVLKLKLAKVWTLTSEKDTFVRCVPDCDLPNTFLVCTLGPPISLQRPKLA